MIMIIIIIIIIIIHDGKYNSTTCTKMVNNSADAAVA